MRLPRRFVSLAKPDTPTNSSVRRSMGSGIWSRSPPRPIPRLHSSCRKQRQRYQELCAETSPTPMVQFRSSETERHRHRARHARWRRHHRRRHRLHHNDRHGHEVESSASRVKKAGAGEGFTTIGDVTVKRRPRAFSASKADLIVNGFTARAPVEIDLRPRPVASRSRARRSNHRDWRRCHRYAEFQSEHPCRWFSPSTPTRRSRSSLPLISARVKSLPPRSAPCSPKAPLRQTSASPARSRESSSKATSPVRPSSPTPLIH